MKTKLSQFLSSQKLLIVLIFAGLYLFSTGVSWILFSFLIKTPFKETITPGELEQARSKINLDLPRTEQCPINGGMFTQIEKNIWEKRRPITAMIENHADSRPSSGLSKADVVYEAVAEGGITRFLAIFYCGAAAYDMKIAPVRSARIYFIDWASEYGEYPIFMHVGGANDFAGLGTTAREARALEALETIGWRIPQGNDFDTTYDSGFPIFWRNYERLDRPVATEHTMVASLDAAYEEAAQRGFSFKDADGKAWDGKFVPWKFSEDKASSSSEASKISFEFWSNKPEYDVLWEYDPSSNHYLRSNGGSKFTDLEFDNEQIWTKNIVIQFVRERGPVDANIHMLYTTTGEGDALVFQNGEMIKATWEKSSRTSRTKFFDSKGKEISFVSGPIWIEAVPKGNEVDYH